MKKTNRIFFTVGNTDYLKHGGRIGKLAGIASSALSLKPLITLVNGDVYKRQLTACSKNYVFSLIMVGGTILILATYPAETMKQILSGTFGAVLFSALIPVSYTHLSR